jgi:hypothetical protein
MCFLAIWISSFEKFCLVQLCISLLVHWFWENLLFEFPINSGYLSISLIFLNLFEYRFSKLSLMISWTSMMFVVISPFAFLILLIWVFSLLSLVRFFRGLSILLIFSKNQLFVSLFFVFFFGFYFIDFSFYFLLFLSFYLFWDFSCFSRSLRCCIRSLIWDLLVFVL